MQSFHFDFQKAGEKMKYQDQRYQRMISRAEEDLSGEDHFAWLFRLYPQVMRLYHRCQTLLAQAEEQVILEQDLPHLRSAEELRDELYHQLQIAQEHSQITGQTPEQCIQFLEEIAYELSRAIQEDPVEL